MWEAVPEPLNKLVDALSQVSAGVGERQVVGEAEVAPSAEKLWQRSVGAALDGAVTGDLPLTEEGDGIVGETFFKISGSRDVEELLHLPVVTFMRGVEHASSLRDVNMHANTG